MSQVTFVAAGTSVNGASGNVTPGLPAGLAIDDIMILVVSSLDNVAHTVAATTGTWTAYDSGTNNGAGLRTSVWWSRAVSGSTAPTVTHTAGSGIVAQMAAYRGCKGAGGATDPADVAITILTQTTGSATATATGVTPGAPKDCLLFLAGFATRQTSPPSGFSSVNSVAYATANGYAPTSTLSRPGQFIAGILNDVNITATGNATATVVSSISTSYLLALGAGPDFASDEHDENWMGGMFESSLVAVGAFGAGAAMLASAAQLMVSPIRQSGDPSEQAAGLYVPVEEYDNGQPASIGLPRSVQDSSFKALVYRSMPYGLGQDFEMGPSLWGTYDDTDTGPSLPSVLPPRSTAAAFLSLLLANDLEDFPQAAGASFQPDEDLWTLPVFPPAPRPAFCLLGIDAEDFPPVQAATFQPDEDFVALALPWPGPKWLAPAQDAEDLPAADFYGQPDDDAWPVAAPGSQTPSVRLVVSAEDEQLFIAATLVLDDVGPIPAPIVAYSLPRLAFTGAEDEVAYLGVDEDGWAPPVPRVSSPLVLVAAVDEQAAPIAVEDDVPFALRQSTAPAQPVQPATDDGSATFSAAVAYALDDSGGVLVVPQVAAWLQPSAWSLDDDVFTFAYRWPSAFLTVEAAPTATLQVKVGIQPTAFLSVAVAPTADLRLK